MSTRVSNQGCQDEEQGVVGAAPVPELWCPGLCAFARSSTLYGVTTDNLVQPAPPTASGSDFARLSREITSAGLMDRRPGYYVARIGVLAVLFAGAWAASALPGTTGWETSTAMAAILLLLFISWSSQHREYGQPHSR